MVLGKRVANRRDAGFGSDKRDSPVKGDTGAKQQGAQMQVHSKQLGRKLVQEIGKEESEPEEGNRKKLLVTFGKHYSP